MAKIIVLKGLPASGKTTWAKAQVAKNGNYVRISRDDLRQALHDGWSAKKEKTIVAIRNAMIKEAISLGKTVIIDDTNLNPQTMRGITALANQLGVKVEINDKFLKIPPEECVKRDLPRGEKAVGASVIWGMYYDFVAPNPLKMLEQNWNKRRCLIVDLDGTLALNETNRDYYDMSRVEEDTPNPFVTALLESIEEISEYYLDVLIVTGRKESGREATKRWLERNMVKYKQMFMRPEDCNISAPDFKKMVYNKYIKNNWAVLGVFDDDSRVCRMYRSLGLQVAQFGCPERERQ